MSVIGILVMAGALIHIVLFGFQTLPACYLAAGLAAAIMGSGFIQKRLTSVDGMRKVIYNLVILTALLAVVIVAPAVVSAGSPMEEVNKGLKESARLMEAKDYGRAERLLAGLLEKRPDVPQLYLNLSTACLMQGKTGEARSLLDRSEQIKSLDADALFNYAMVYYQEGDYKSALDYLKKALLQKPDQMQSWLYASESAARVRDLKGAGYFAGRAVEIWPDRPAVRCQLARVKLMTMDYRDALDQLDAVLELQPGPEMREEILKLRKEAEYYKNKL